MVSKVDFSSSGPFGGVRQGTGGVERIGVVSREVFSSFSGAPFIKRRCVERPLFERLKGEESGFSAFAHLTLAARGEKMGPSLSEDGSSKNSPKGLSFGPPGSPLRAVRSVEAAPAKVLKKRAAPSCCVAVKKAFELLKKGSFSIVCVDRAEHLIQFWEQGRGEFSAFSLIFPGQPQILDGVSNDSLGVKIFHEEMRHFDSGMQERMIKLYRDLRAAGISCPEVYNAEEFVGGCGYLLVEKVPLPSGSIAPEELLALTATAYEKKLFIDLKPDNLRRTLAGDLKLVDWGGELSEDDDSLDAHFRKILRVLGLEEFAKTCPVLRSLTRS